MTRLLRYRRKWCPVWLACAVLLVTACGEDAGAPEGVHSTVDGASVGGSVVSTVDGQAITLREVRALARSGELTPREALRRLQAESLLIAEARRRGLSSRAPVREVGRRALVHALLDEEAGSAEVAEQELRARYAAAGERFNAAERRASLHVLAQLAEDATPEQDAAGRRYVRDMIERLRGGEEPEALIDELHGTQKDGFVVVVQKLPPVPDTVNFAKPYLDALFSLDAPGVFGEPVKTSFGWHAIWLLEIVPARGIAFGQAAAELKEEALLQERIDRVRGLIDELRSDIGVEIAEGAHDAMASLKP